MFSLTQATIPYIFSHTQSLPCEVSGVHAIVEDIHSCDLTEAKVRQGKHQTVSETNQ